MGPLALALLICIVSVVIVFCMTKALVRWRRDSCITMPAIPATPLMQGARIGPRTARLLQGSFLIFIGLPAIYEFASHPAEESRAFLQFARKPNAKARDELEERLSRNSEWARETRRAYQAIATRTLRQGSSKVILGKDGYLFLRDDVRFALGPGFLSPEFQNLRPPTEAKQDAVRKLFGFLFGKQPASKQKPARPKGADIIGCIVDFRDQLQSRGIHLILLPVPCKATIYPEKLWPAYSEQAGPALNGDWAAFLQRLADAKVDVLDLTAAMWNAKRTADPSLWLRYDTHWSPAGVTVAANHLAARVRSWVANVKHHPFCAVPSMYVEDADGDLIRFLLEQRADPRFGEPVEFALTKVCEGAHAALAGDDAPVLLLGDSFANIYSEDAAGLAHQMMLRLRVPVQEIEVFAVSPKQGIYDPRQVLAERTEFLTTKKVVVWEFTCRVLSDPERPWEKFPLPTRVPPN